MKTLKATNYGRKRIKYVFLLKISDWFYNLYMRINDLRIDFVDDNLL